MVASRTTQTTPPTIDDARLLVCVPILHSAADMGTVGEKLAAAYVERFGRRTWQEHVALIDGFWQAVRLAVERLDLDYSRVSVYQDGLPVCGRELQIVTKAASLGSENHRLVLELVTRGAELVGTEDPGLLIEEYRLLQAALSVTAGASLRENASVSAKPDDSQQMLAQRDAFIARRIGATLQPGRTGLLFIGMLHEVEPLLPADIVVRRLDAR